MTVPNPLGQAHAWEALLRRLERVQATFASEGDGVVAALRTLLERDGPIGPIVVGELQNAIVAAADAHKLPMAKDDALKAFGDVTTEFGLAIVPGSLNSMPKIKPSPTLQ